MPGDVRLFIDGQWCDGADGRTVPYWNPATGDVIGLVAVAERADLDRALAAADTGFRLWRRTSPFERCRILRRGADLLRERAGDIGLALTLEEGKPLAEGRGEVLAAADLLDWFAEEGRRTYGRVIPARAEDVRQIVVREPIGPVAAFTPWNFPLAQAIRKIGAALAAGCSIILKAPEETPASCAGLVAALADAGVPAGVLALVYGVPAEISEYLIPHPVIRKVSFTGSTAVGKRLAALAGAHMKRATMELGGHGPVIVFPDVDVGVTTQRLAAFKFRNAGQVCASPTRLLVHEDVHDAFLADFVARAEALSVGDPTDPATTMGPLANVRRIQAMESLVADAVAHGGRVVTGGERIGNRGNFYRPTVLADVPLSARIMNEEPFGPIVIVRRWRDLDEALAESNRLAYGLAAYAYTRSHADAARVADAFEAGMVSINHHGLALPEVPFGGVKDSGFGSEGGTEAMEGYLVSKFVTHAGM